MMINHGFGVKLHPSKIGKFLPAGVMGALATVLEISAMTWIFRVPIRGYLNLLAALRLLRLLA